MSALAMYERMSTLSAQMVEAAASGDWDRLVALEKDCAGLARQLEAGERPASLDETGRTRKVALIRKILADDAEVRRHTEPWMEQVKQFLGGAARERSVRLAYGVPPGR